MFWSWFMKLPHKSLIHILSLFINERLYEDLFVINNVNLDIQGVKSIKQSF